MKTQANLRSSLWIATFAILALTGCSETFAPQTSGISTDDQDRPVTPSTVAASRDDVVQSSGGSQGDASGRYEQSVCIGETAVVTISTGGHYENRSDFFMPNVIPAGISTLIPALEDFNTNSIATLVAGDEKTVSLS